MNNDIITVSRLDGSTSQKTKSNITKKLHLVKSSKMRNLLSIYYRLQKDVIGYKKHIVHTQSNKDLNTKLSSKLYCICVHTRSGWLIKTKSKFLNKTELRRWILNDYIGLRKYRAEL